MGGNTPYGKNLITGSLFLILRVNSSREERQNCTMAESAPVKWRSENYIGPAVLISYQTYKYTKIHVVFLMCCNIQLLEFLEKFQNVNQMVFHERRSFYVQNE